MALLVLSLSKGIPPLLLQPCCVGSLQALTSRCLACSALEAT
jgi:hypothetical protein